MRSSNITSIICLANPEDKVQACNSIAQVASQDEPRSQIVQQNIVRLICPLLEEKDLVLVGSSLQCLYELSCQSEDMVHHLMALDVMTPLLSLISKFGKGSPILFYFKYYDGFNFKVQRRLLKRPLL